MMRLRPRWRIVLREFKQNKGRNSLVILTMIAGIFAIGFVVNLHYILSHDMTASYLTSNPASAIFYVNEFDDELVTAVRQMPGVLDAEGRGWLPLRFQAGAGEWRNLTLFAISDYDDIEISQVRPEAGQWPPADREMLIERTSVNFLGATTGGKVRVRTPAGVERDLPVVGEAYDVNQRSGELRGEAYGYITMDTLEWLGQPYAYDQLHIILEDQSDALAVWDTVRELRIQVEKVGYPVRFVEMPPTPGVHPDNDKVQAIVLILAFIGVFSLVSSVLLVVNTISFLLTQQVRQIGVMKAIGSSTGQIMKLYLMMIFAFSLIALLLAVPLAAVGARMTAVYLAGLLNFDLVTITFPPSVFLLEVGVGLIVPIIATLYPVYAGARITVREALASYGLGDENAGATFINYLLGRIQRFPRPLLLSLRNAFRRKGRLALTLATLVLGGTMFIAISNLYASATATLVEQFEAYGQYDVQVHLREPGRLGQIERVVGQTPDVVATEAWAADLGRRLRDDGNEGSSFSMVGVPSDSQVLKPILMEGRWLRSDDENAAVISAYMLELEPDLEVGSEMTVKLRGRETVWRIVGITNGPISEGMVYTHFDDLTYQTRQVDRAQIVFFSLEQHDPAYQAQMGNLIERTFTDMGMDVSLIETTSSSQEKMRSEFLPIVIILIIMAVVLAIIGGIGLVGTMSINVLERTREIGVMRAIGASDGAVRQVVTVEGMVVGVVSWLIGAVLAWPLGYMLSNQVGYAMAQAPLSYIFSWGGVFLWLGVALLLTILASWLPARRAMKISVREALVYE